MAKKKEPTKPKGNPAVEGLKAEVTKQVITQTLEENYMPYAMSVIVSRAIPEIDGFKPSHRKLLYTMYQMKLLTGNRTKSANVVGSTMKLNPHGDGAIYETMVRLARGNGALLHPLVDSKGNFGKVYSRDMAYAASRYTEVKLDDICQEVFRDIEHNTVEFMDNYDQSMKEPMLLPTTFPNVLVSANQGIAVGMASNLCGFNLKEVCDTAIALMDNPEHELLDTLLAPDLPTGGELLYDAKEIEGIYRTGRGSFKVRAKWRHLPKENMIEVYEIPYSTTVEAIIDKIVDLVKTGKIKEVSDVRDETDLSGLKIALDLKRGTEPEKLMAKLFRWTPLLDSQSCNFNILVGGMPRVMGVREILKEWTDWRCGSVRGRTLHFMEEKQAKLHKLKGLQKILLDIDKAIAIVRGTEEDSQVIPNLMIGFGIDKIQADYVADIRLRNMNQDYILKRTQEIQELEEELKKLQEILDNPQKILEIIKEELGSVSKKYAIERHTEIIYGQTMEEIYEEEEVASTPVHCFLSQEGYFKKITPQSLRMASEQKYKEGDSFAMSWDCQSSEELLVFTDMQQCYKTRVDQFEDSKASVLGEYLPTKLGMEPEEKVVFCCITGTYAGNLFFVFTNGKVARIELGSYQTQSKRKKLAKAYSDKFPLHSVIALVEETELLLQTSDNRCLVFHSSALSSKSTRSSQGVSVMNVKTKHEIIRACTVEASGLENIARYRAKNLPMAGLPLKEEEVQLSFWEGNK